MSRRRLLEGASTESNFGFNHLEDGNSLSHLDDMLGRISAPSNISLESGYASDRRESRFPM